MATAWRVTHEMAWSARGTVLSGALFFTLVSLLVTVVPPGLVFEEHREVARFGERLHDSVEVLPETLAVALAWAGVALLALPWAWVARWLWKATLEQLRDLFGAHRFVEGVIERVELRGQGNRRRAVLHVAGEASACRCGCVRQGALVRLRVTRFNALALDLAVAEAPAS